MTPIRILLADDHEVLRRGVISMLADEADFEVVGEASNTESTIALARHLKPDIVLMDYRMPDEEHTAVKMTASLCEDLPKTRVIVLSAFDFQTYLKQAFHFGARGYLLKDCLADELAEAIRTVHAGGIFICQKLQKWVRYDPKAPHQAQILSVELLTEREDEVFHLLIQGSGRKEIAHLLDIDEKTVDNHRSSIFYKVGVKNVAQLVRYAMEAGLFNP